MAPCGLAIWATGTSPAGTFAPRRSKRVEALLAHFRPNRGMPQIAPVDLLAITEQQISDNDLPVIQKFDRRTQKSNPAVETEALGQDEIERIVRAWLDGHLLAHGHASLDALHQREQKEREQALDRLNDTGVGL
jgi:hypothetical protein